MTGSIRALLCAGVLALTAVVGRTAAAEVSLPYKNITLNGNAVLADGKTWKDGAILLVHGTLAHGGMELIAALQKLLKEKSRTSVAINLGYNIDNRRGFYDCARPHTHKLHDAVDEIAAWVAWLKGRGAGDIVVLGHSRGGNQVARYAVGAIDPVVKAIVLLAPATWNSVRAARLYEQRHKASLARVLANAQEMAKAGKSDSLMSGIGFLTCENATASAASVLSYYSDDKKMDTPAIVGNIPVPTLVVAGSTDELVPDIPEKMKGRVQGQVKFKVIDGADHFFRDLYTEDLVDLVVQFLGG
jgi:pimeloyl-ACP methyl ester carboxylesterase